MLFQKRVDQALEDLHNENQSAELYDQFLSAEQKREEEKMELEKGDRLAMLLAAFLVLVPVAVLVLGLIAAAAFFLT